MNTAIVILCFVTSLHGHDNDTQYKRSRRQSNSVCTGVNSFGQQITARCYHPDYDCSCVNRPTEYPSCQCELKDNSDTGSDTGDAGVTWKPLYVVSIGGGVLLIVLLTSVACCCLCRQWYSRRVPTEHDKPPEYCDSPPPPYVHSSFYNNQPRPRTVQRGVGRIVAGPSAPNPSTPNSPIEMIRSSTAPDPARARRLRGAGTSSGVFSDSGVLPGSVYRDSSISDSSDVIVLPRYRNYHDDIHVVDVDS